MAVLVFGGGTTLAALGEMHRLERVLRGKRYAERLRRREERYKRLWQKTGS